MSSTSLQWTVPPFKLPRLESFLVTSALFTSAFVYLRFASSRPITSLHFALLLCQFIILQGDSKPYPVNYLLSLRAELSVLSGKSTSIVEFTLSRLYIFYEALRNSLLPRLSSSRLGFRTSR